MADEWTTRPDSGSTGDESSFDPRESTGTSSEVAPGGTSTTGAQRPSVNFAGVETGTGFAGGSAPNPNPAGWMPVGGAYPPPPSSAAPGSPVPPYDGAPPNPTAAGLLGVIPGVGAMYNGQYAKGIVHIFIFALLVSLADNVSGVFGIFVAAWIFYQAFEAYHTARARVDGLPLPDPFGWNHIGERMGFGRNWTAGSGRPSAHPATGWQPWGVPASPPSQVPVPGAPLEPAAYPSPVSPAQGQAFTPGQSPIPSGAASASYAGEPAGWRGHQPPANWAGYVPPAAFAAATPYPQAPAGTTAAEPTASSLPGQSVPYSAVNTGQGEPVPEIDPAFSPRRFPVGAVWLIVLGILFLLGQWTPLLRISHEWVPSLLLAGLAVWIFLRRMGWGFEGCQRTSGIPEHLRLASALRAPGLLLTVAVLMALQAAHVVWMSRSWPWLLIAFGAILLLERVLARPNIAYPWGTSTSGNDPDSQGGQQ